MIIWSWLNRNIIPSLFTLPITTIQQLIINLNSPLSLLLLILSNLFINNLLKLGYLVNLLLFKHFNSSSSIAHLFFHTLNIIYYHFHEHTSQTIKRTDLQVIQQNLHIGWMFLPAKQRMHSQQLLMHQCFVIKLLQYY